MSLGGRPCAQGKRREIIPAVPFSPHTRTVTYARQAGRVFEDGSIAATWQPAPAQRRRIQKKRRHHDARASRP